MDISVQVLQSSKSDAIIDKLRRLDVKVNKPYSDDSALLHVNYNDAFGVFHDINTVDLIISDGVITASNHLEFLYALLKNKPIASLKPFTYEVGVDGFTQHLLNNYQQAFYIKDILTLNDVELGAFLVKATRHHANYDLSPRETTLIRSRVRAYFQRMAQSTIVA